MSDDFEDLPPIMMPPLPAKLPQFPSPKKTDPHFEELTPREKHEVFMIQKAIREHARGWNLFCNVCGKAGASWCREPEVEAPTGRLAVCPGCYEGIRREIQRHRKELDYHYAVMQQLTLASYPVQPTDRAVNYAWDEWAKGFVL